jgi:hypothetical protein
MQRDLRDTIQYYTHSDSSRKSMSNYHSYTTFLSSFCIYMHEDVMRYKGQLLLVKILQGLLDEYGA